MCMWCTATRNLQRPELHWGDLYPLRDHRDLVLLNSKPTSGVVDPPLSFIHSVRTRSSDGVDREILLSPENEAHIESMVDTYKSGNSLLSSLTVHVHIAFVSSAHAHLPCNSRPLRILRFVASGYNVNFVYPRGVSRSSYISHLPNPSDVWKAFNPALCKPHELPKLILLRDCVLDETPTSSSKVNEQTRLHNSEYSPPPNMTPSSPPAGTIPKCRGVSYDSEVLDTFRGYRFDIGAIDYRGHFDCSYSAWFVRHIPASPHEKSSPVKREPVW